MFPPRSRGEDALKKGHGRAGAAGWVAAHEPSEDEREWSRVRDARYFGKRAVLLKAPDGMPFDDAGDLLRRDRVFVFAAIGIREDAWLAIGK